MRVPPAELGVDPNASFQVHDLLGQLDKPEVDAIEGLTPAVAIDQKSGSKNPRSTVGTITEIYDHLRLLWARVGEPHCPVCGALIRSYTPQPWRRRILPSLTWMNSPTS